MVSGEVNEVLDLRAIAYALRRVGLVLAVARGGGVHEAGAAVRRRAVREHHHVLPIVPVQARRHPVGRHVLGHVPRVDDRQLPVAALVRPHVRLPHGLVIAPARRAARVLKATAKQSKKKENCQLFIYDGFCRPAHPNAYTPDVLPGVFIGVNGRIRLAAVSDVKKRLEFCDSVSDGAGMHHLRERRNSVMGDDFVRLEEGSHWRLHGVHGHLAGSGSESEG